MTICTLPEVKAWIGIPDSNTDHDTTLQILMDSTEKAILNFCDSKFSLTPVINEVTDGTRSDTIVTKYWPIRSVQEIRFWTKADGSDGNVLDPEYYTVKEDGIILQGLKTTPFWRSTVGIDYTYGYDGVPADVKAAFLQAVEAQFRRKGRKTIGMASRSKKDESESYSGDGDAWDGLTGLPKEIVAMLQPYKSFEFPTQPMATRNV